MRAVRLLCITVFGEKGGGYSRCASPQSLAQSAAQAGGSGGGHSYPHPDDILAVISRSAVGLICWKNSDTRAATPVLRAVASPTAVAEPASSMPG